MYFFWSRFDDGVGNNHAHTAVKAPLPACSACLGRVVHATIWFWYDVVRSSSSAFCQSQSVVAEQKRSTRRTSSSNSTRISQLSLWHPTLAIGGINDNGAIPIPYSPTLLPWYAQWCLSEGRHTSSTHIMVAGFVCCDRHFSTTALALVCWWVENKNPFFLLQGRRTSSVIYFQFLMCFPLASHYVVKAASQKPKMDLQNWNPSNRTIYCF